MSIIGKAAAAVWDFIVGDDWRAALGAVLALAGTAAANGLGLAAWWVAALGALAALGWAVRAAARR